MIRPKMFETLQDAANAGFMVETDTRKFIKENVLSETEDIQVFNYHGIYVSLEDLQNLVMNLPKDYTSILYSDLFLVKENSSHYVNLVAFSIYHPYYSDDIEKLNNQKKKLEQMFSLNNVRSLV